MKNKLTKKRKKNKDIENFMNNKRTSHKIKITKNLSGEKIKEKKKLSFFTLSRNNKNNQRNIDYNKNNIKNNSMPNIHTKALNISQNHISINKSSDIKVNANRNNKNLNPYKTTTNFKNIQTMNSKFDNINISKEYNSNKNNKISFGKSLKQILINNIKEIIESKGNIIQKIKRKNYSTILYRSGYNNNNNFDLHKQIFDLKLVELYEKYKKMLTEYRNKKIEELNPTLELKRQEMKIKMPLLIRGYNKKDLDIYYTRDICDLDYQNYYNKNQLNLKDILENHNKNNRREYISGNIPFFLLTKSIYKPTFKKILSQNLNNKIQKEVHSLYTKML